MRAYSTNGVFLKYNHHIGLISGIAWDHANVFPSEEEYVKQFDLFADQTPKGGTLIYCDQDSMALIIGKKERADVAAVSYKSHPHSSDNQGNYFLVFNKEKYPIKVFGSHNFQNISGAREVVDVAARHCARKVDHPCVDQHTSTCCR